MSKLEKFKSLAQAAFEGVTREEKTSQPASQLAAAGLQGTERLKGARLIPLDRITPDPDQPRTQFPEKSLQEMADSIASHGILQPLTVSYTPASGTFTIVTGERRYRAARRAGLTQAPCIVLSKLNQRDRFHQQLVENLQREDITPFEEAHAFRTLTEKFHLKHQQIAQIVAKSRSYVTKTIGLTRIPEPIRHRCAQRGITSREQLILLAQQKTEPAMLALLEKLAHQDHNVRTMRKTANSSRSHRRENRPVEFRYQSHGYTVRVRFAKHKVSTREIRAALTEALKSLEREP